MKQILNNWNYIYSWIKHNEKLVENTPFRVLLDNVILLYTGKISHCQFASIVIDWFEKIGKNQKQNDVSELFTGFNDEKEVWGKTVSKYFPNNWSKSISGIIPSRNANSL